MFAAVIIHYNDDYKSRHGSCDEYSEPKLFKLKVNAEKYVAEEIADAICERYSDLDAEELSEAICEINSNLDEDDDNVVRNKDLFIYDEDGIITDFIDVYKFDLEQMEKFRKALLKGEFVDYKMDYEIYELEFED
jgi:hypothetical protein